MKCPHCAAENKDAAKFCGKCGQSLATPLAQTESSKPCSGCGHVCKSDAKFCPKCGQNFSAVPLAEKVVAATVSVAALDVMACPHCGAALKLGAKFCGKCGNSITAAKQEETLPASVAVEEIAHPPMGAVIELPKTTPLAEDKPAQPLPESIVKTDKPAVPAAETKAPPPAVEKPVIETTDSESLKPSRKVPLAPIVAGMAALIIALGTGGYFFMKEKSSPNANEAALAKPTIQPAAVSPTPTTPPLAAAPKPEELPSPNAPSVAPALPPATEKPAAPPLAEPLVTKPSVSKLKQAAREAVPAQANPLQAAIDAGLEEGEKCMGRKKFDCAISSSNTILRLDSRNARALEMKRKATEAQDRALSQIDIR